MRKRLELSYFSRHNFQHHVNTRWGLPSSHCSRWRQSDQTRQNTSKTSQDLCVQSFYLVMWSLQRSLTFDKVPHEWKQPYYIISYTTILYRTFPLSFTIYNSLFSEESLPPYSFSTFFKIFIKHWRVSARLTLSTLILRKHLTRLDMIFCRSNFQNFQLAVIYYVGLKTIILAATKEWLLLVKPPVHSLSCPKAVSCRKDLEICLPTISNGCNDGEIKFSARIHTSNNHQHSRC